MPPFITGDDEYVAGSKSPRQIGQVKLRSFTFNMAMTDDEMRAMAEQAIELKKTYTKWEAFYQDLDARRKRLLGFQAVVKALDLNVAAAFLETTPQLVAALMDGNAKQEGARLAELQTLWNEGILPDIPVLTDPSKDVVNTTPPAAAFSVAVDPDNDFTYKFTDKSTGNPVGWQWNFGDGTTSTEQNPTHIYTDGGEYTITLVAVNSAGNSEAINTEVLI